MPQKTLWPIVVAEWVRMFWRFVLRNRQWYGGRWWNSEEVLLTLAHEYNITASPVRGRRDWIREVLRHAYQADRGASQDWEHQWSAANKRVQADFERFREMGVLPGYVMSARLDCVSATLFRHVPQS